MQNIPTLRLVIQIVGKSKNCDWRRCKFQFAKGLQLAKCAGNTDSVKRNVISKSLNVEYLNKCHKNVIRKCTICQLSYCAYIETCYIFSFSVNTISS